jgi:hypothetical protein
MTTATSMFEQLPLEQLEEASGELHRRAGTALRRIDEARSDEPDAEGVSPRERLAGLIASKELAVATLAAVAAGAEPPRGRSDAGRQTIAAITYGAPTLAGLLARLEQDRRMLTSLARHLEERLDEASETAWGRRRLREVVVELAIAEPARCAQALEERLAAIVEEERAAAEAAAEAAGERSDDQPSEAE